MTVTLQDVAGILGFPTDRQPVTGPTTLVWIAVCQHVFGTAPVAGTDIHGGDLRISYLDRIYPDWFPVAHNPDEVRRYTQAHILRLLGSWLLCDRLGGSKIACRYAPLLGGDFQDIGTYSWGFNSLAPFKPHEQSWFWEILDTLYRDEVMCQPYGEYHTALLVSDHERYLWLAITPIICFHTVECAQPDRCMRQFGFDQPIPRRQRKLKGVHDLTLRGKKDDNWERKLRPFVN
ncbi:protein MAIN-LIKE 2-like [Gastrolobium bilobum]|uniref:protein MAIN-LIKE 2-like n=1 Tax=Gastrolobium bilobum TaxID=150636 RepID=UPI002AB10132|nr:protein MAIN-LIKE 2-like [Gastrolobium bilobum]